MNGGKTNPLGENMTFKEELLLRLLPLCVPQNMGSLTGSNKATEQRREGPISDRILAIDRLP